MKLRTAALWESASPGKLRHAPRVDSLATAHEKGQPQSTDLSRVTENSGGATVFAIRIGVEAREARGVKVLGVITNRSRSPGYRRVR